MKEYKGYRISKTQFGYWEVYGLGAQMDPQNTYIEHVPTFRTLRAACAYIDRMTN